MSRLKPAVPRNWLLALAGLMWSAVGVTLCRLAYSWLTEIHWRGALALEFTGLVLALTVYRFAFSRIAQKNIERILTSPEWACLFSFQAWKSYLTIGLMITIGILLRNSPIPKYYLAILYTTIGGALLLGGFRYYGCFWRAVVRKGP